jgi:hypothetical protein
MSTQTTDELLAEVAEVRRPQPGDTWVDKVLLWFLGKLEKRLRTAREVCISVQGMDGGPEALTKIWGLCPTAHKTPRKGEGSAHSP